MTCYEVRFPEVARRLAELGAEVLLLPAAWVRGPLKELHWETLTRARAIENTVYVAAAGQVGTMYTGLSAIYDPMGNSQRATRALTTFRAGFSLLRKGG